jgi:hypothetical protein
MPPSSSYIYVIGRLFNVDSISTNIMRKSSNVNVARPMDFFKHLLTLFIKRSQKPPCHGAFSTMNFHETPLFARCCCTSGERLIFYSSLLADFFKSLLARNCKKLSVLRKCNNITIEANEKIVNFLDVIYP